MVSPSSSRRWLATLLAMAASPLAAKRDHPTPRWTIADIVTAPDITDLALDADGNHAAYIVRTADIARDRPTTRLVMVDLASGQQTVLLEARQMSSLKRRPGRAGWSLLADTGEGQQLYALSVSDPVRLVRAHRPTARVGTADGSTQVGSLDLPIEVGILSYSWSPDGRWLWYATINPDPAETVLYDEAVVDQLGVRRPRRRAQIVYHLGSADGKEHEVARRPASDRVAQFLGGAVTWLGDAVEFVTEAAADIGGPAYQRVKVRLDDGIKTPAGSTLAPPWASALSGPYGGILRLEGGASPRLVERSGTRLLADYGAMNISLDDPRSAGHWRSADGSRLILGVRYLDRPRYGLLVIDRSGQRAIPVADSLTHCDFTEALDRGVCIREGLNRAPQLVQVRPGKGSVALVTEISPRHSAIAPLRTEAMHWTNPAGYRASGFLIYPRDYRAEQRYPLILVTHGSDADERFCQQGLQWNYPIQLLAEEGYLVLLVNDPAPSQAAALSAAYTQWGSGEGALDPATIQQRIWLEGVSAFEAAARQLIDRGLADPDRIGIAGYSRGAQMTNVAMTQSRLFRAASSGDGGYLEPSAYPRLSRSYDMVFGGSPYGPAIVHYRALCIAARRQGKRAGAAANGDTPGWGHRLLSRPAQRAHPRTDRPLSRSGRQCR